MSTTAEAAGRNTFRRRVGARVTGRRFSHVITALIVINAAILGFQTSDRLDAIAGPAMSLANQAILAVFVVEIALKLFAFGPRFFLNGWNVFDFAIVGISLVPASQGLSILRALRILRVLRLLSTVERLRFLIEAFLRSLPSISWIAFLLLMVFYIFGVMGTELFSERFPEWFGTVGRTMFTLFQVMTLESWSMGIARPVMEAYPYAWIYFITFILVSSFTILNLFIGIIVNTMQAVHWEQEEQQMREISDRAEGERRRILEALERMDQRLERLEMEGPGARGPGPG